MLRVWNFFYMAAKKWKEKKTCLFSCVCKNKLQQLCLPPGCRKRLYGSVHSSKNQQCECIRDGQRFFSQYEDVDALLQYQPNTAKSWRRNQQTFDQSRRFEGTAGKEPNIAFGPWNEVGESRPEVRTGKNRQHGFQKEDKASQEGRFSQVEQTNHRTGRWCPHVVLHHSNSKMWTYI